MIPANRKLLVARFPALVDWIEAAPLPGSLAWLADLPRPTLEIAGMRIVSGHAPEEEARLQARLVPEYAQRARVYGVGSGHLVRALLARPALRELFAYVLHPGVLRACLERWEASDWLGDPRLSLLRGRSLRELEPPFAAQPVCLKLAEEECRRLCDLVQLELATPHLRRHLRESEPVARARVDANRGLLQADGDVAELFGTWPGAHVHVAAAGPSLARRYEELRCRPAGEPLIAVDGALLPLVHAGVRPDIVCSQDTNEEAMVGLLDAPPDAVAGTRLVYEPVVARAALERWPGRRLAFFSEHARYGELLPGLERGVLWSSGSVFHCALDLAVRAGAARVTMHGADFATLGGQSHVEGFAWRKKIAAAGSGRPTLVSGNGQPIPSLPNLVGYLRDLERYLERHPEVCFVNAGREGARIEGTSYREEVHGG